MEALKEILAHFPQGFASGLIMNGGLITICFLIFWRWLKKPLKNWRIQLQQRFDMKQLRGELLNSLTTLSVGAIYSGIVIYMGTQGYSKIYTDVSEHHALWSIARFFIILLVDATWFYWLHRLLHHPKLYRYVHRVHHQSIDVNPYTSMSFHVGEALLLSLWIFPLTYFVPIYAPVLLFAQIWGTLDNIKAHLGYEIYPAWVHKSWLYFMTTSTHHNMHHSDFNGNYRVHFRFWDWLCGTEFKEYEAKFDGIHARKKGVDMEEQQTDLKESIATFEVRHKGLHALTILEEEKLLDAAIRKEIGVPYACRRGKCGTCKCQLLEGEVEMPKAEALSAEERENGEILLCQSRPKSRHVMVGF